MATHNRVRQPCRRDTVPRRPPSDACASPVLGTGGGRAGHPALVHPTHILNSLKDLLLAPEEGQYVVAFR